MTEYIINIDNFFFLLPTYLFKVYIFISVLKKKGENFENRKKKNTLTLLKTSFYIEDEEKNIINKTDAKNNEKYKNEKNMSH